MEGGEEGGEEEEEGEKNEEDSKLRNQRPHAPQKMSQKEF